MEKLESLQYQVGLAVMGMWQGKNPDRVYEELDGESLHLRQCFGRLTVFYKITKNSTPHYLRDLAPPLEATSMVILTPMTYIHCGKDPKDFRILFSQYCQMLEQLWTGHQEA